jgi:hypothetical protein
MKGDLMSTGKSGGSRDTIDVTTGQAVRKVVTYGAGGSASVETFPIESSSPPSSGLPSSHAGGHPTVGQNQTPVPGSGQ